MQGNGWKSGFAGRVRFATCVGLVQLVIGAAEFGLAAEPEFKPESDSERSASFARDVVPLLTRAGCNSGACHGAAAGRGYLQLSLYGCRPREDYLALANSPGGRLIDLADPENSLLLLKPSEQMEHGGGEQLEMDSHPYKTLLRWIESGVAADRLQAVTEIKTQPAESLEVLVGEEATIDIEVRFGQRELEDADASLVVVEGAIESARSDSGVTAALSFTRTRSGIRLRATKTGYFPIILRFGPVAQAIAVWAVEQPQAHRTASQEHTEASPGEDTTAQGRPMGPSRVDRWLQPTIGRLQRTGTAEADAPMCSNTTLARRMYVDLFGRLPSLSEWKSAVQILDSDGARELVDTMLGSEEFAWQAQKQILGWGGIPETAQYTRLRQALASRIVEDDNLRAIAEDMLKVSPTSTALNDLHRLAAGPRERTELIASMWMGVQVGCAKCHDHPLDHWTQDDYFAMAACWAPIETGGKVRRVDGRTTTDLRTEQAAVPVLPDGSPAGELPDHALVDWLVATDNPYFAPNLANRIWDWLMGQGVVMPVGDFRSTNLPIAPELLRGLTAELEGNGYSLRHLVRTIVCSEAYRRKSTPDAAALALRAFAARSSKEIDFPTETLVAQALGVRVDEQPVHAAGEMMAATTDNCTRPGACADPTSQRIELVRGEAIGEAIAAGLRHTEASLPGGSAIEVLASVHEQLFGRAASREEISSWQGLMDRHVGQTSDQASTSEAKGLRNQKAASEFAEALVWSWVVSDNFLRLH